MYRIIRIDTEEYYVPHLGGREHHIIKGWETIYCRWTLDESWIKLAGEWPTREQADEALRYADDIHIDRNLCRVTAMYYCMEDEFPIGGSS